MNIFSHHTARTFTCVNHFILICLIAAGCSMNTEESVQPLPFPYPNTSRTVAYVGSEKCKPCHEKIYSTYMQSEMGRSMARVSDAPPIERFTDGAVKDAGLNFSYSVFSKDGKVFQKEFRTNKNGTRAHERIVEAEYIMGSGNNLRMYFFEESGMLYEHPLTWYVNQKKFDLSPGYRDFSNLRFSRFASAKCLSCHNSYLTPDSTAVDRYQTPFPLGIGCERCHGPGELHIKEALGDDLPGVQEGSLSIINPRKLPHQQQLDVCQQCHLQGKAWVLTKNDDNYFDFRPGELLSAHRSVYFKAGAKKNVVEVGDSPQRLAMSRCFQESGKTMTCITCHNPHRSIKSFTAAHYNAQCISCHTEAALRTKKLSPRHIASENCISCHMNRTGTNNTLHGVSNTDHWIRTNANAVTMNWESLRKPSHQSVTHLSAFLDNGDSLSGERLAEAYLYYYQEHDPRDAYLDSALAYCQLFISSKNATIRSYHVAAQVYAYRRLYPQSIEYYSTAIALSPNNSELRYQLGTVFLTTNDLNGALPHFLTASSQKPNEPKYLESIGIVYYRLSRFSDAKRYLQMAVNKDTQNSDPYFYLGNIFAVHEQNPAAALPNYRRAVELTPDRVNGHLNLGNTYLLLGVTDSAIIRYQLEIERDPRSISAFINLGRAFAINGDGAKAKQYYRKALEIDPSSAAARELLFQ